MCFKGEQNEAMQQYRQRLAEEQKVQPAPTAPPAPVPAILRSLFQGNGAQQPVQHVPAQVVVVPTVVPTPAYSFRG